MFTAQQNFYSLKKKTKTRTVQRASRCQTSKQFWRLFLCLCMTMVVDFGGMSYMTQYQGVNTLPVLDVLSIHSKN